MMEKLCTVMIKTRLIGFTLAFEIKYICEEAETHTYSFNRFKRLLLNRINMEQDFKDFEELK